MGWKEFVATIVVGLAWPCALLAVGLLFREQIAGILKRIKAVEFGGARAEIQDDLKLADAAAAEVTKQVPAHVELEIPNVVHEHAAASPAISTTAVSLPTFDVVVAESPALAVVSIWMEIATTLREIAELYGIETSHKPPMQIVRTLAAVGALPWELENLLDALRRVRNQAVHAPSADQVTLQDALRFRENADVVLEALRIGKAMKAR